jgi:hypothetical protein
MSSVTIKTVAANSDNCKDNCPTKSLETYVKENNGYAGINGTYFCPPDYSSCSGKVNSYDYAFYNSNRDKWLNKGALSWSKTGLMTFNGSSVKFYKKIIRLRWRWGYSRDFKLPLAFRRWKLCGKT